MGKNYNGTQISQSVTVSEVAGATVEDCRNKIFVYDENGKAILATGGTKPLTMASNSSRVWVPPSRFFAIRS